MIIVISQPTLMLILIFLMMIINIINFIRIRWLSVKLGEGLEAEKKKIFLKYLVFFY